MVIRMLFLTLMKVDTRRLGVTIDGKEERFTGA
jgi:hypothetical protein